MTRRRYALCVRYDGSRYHGWQKQGTPDDLITVQLMVEKALSQVAHHQVIVTCAGRTDARVHATGQIIHFDTDADRTDHAWVFGANSNLPHDISILWAKEVPLEFHARFSAVSRRYRYLMYNYPIRPGILRHAVGWYHTSLDDPKMLEAAQYLLGEHDFSSFRGAGCQAKSPVRTIEAITIKRQRHMLIIELQANAFLLHMVRNIVGVLVQIGAQRQPVGWMSEVLTACNRQAAAETIAPNGLYLVKVGYPEQFELPDAPIGPFFLPDLLV